MHRGTTPCFSGGPKIVYDFPAHVAPYEKIVPFIPLSAPSTIGNAKSKTSSYVVSGPKTLSKKNY